jgi:predicted DNA-binding antitoxin AbrB/MazE fold protein
MSTIIDAVYEHGVFRPAVPPDLAEGTSVRLTVSPAEAPAPPPEGRTAYDIIAAIVARSAKPGPAENTSENVDAILYGRPGDHGDVR